MLDAGPIDLIDAAAAAGFDGVGLRLSADHDPGRSGRDAASVAAHARRRGVSVDDVEVHRIGTDDGAAPLLDAAVVVGASRVLVVSDRGERSATIAGLRDVVAAAGERGLTVGLEYMAWTDPSSPLEALQVADETGCGVVVDLLHHVRVGAGVAELEAIVASGRLAWVQLCDGPSVAPRDLLHEARHHRLAPGAGDLPLVDLLAVVPPAVPLSVEVQSDALAAGHLPAERAMILAAATGAVLAQLPNTTG